MAKSLSQRIAERAETKTPTKAGKNRAAFLAVRGEIEGALDDGWPVKTIWETLRQEGKIEFCYESFNQYVHRLIGPRHQPRPTTASIPGPAATDDSKVKPGVQDAAAQKSTNTIRASTFNRFQRKRTYFNGQHPHGSAG